MFKEKLASSIRKNGEISGRVTHNTATVYRISTYSQILKIMYTGSFYEEEMQNYKMSDMIRYKSKIMIELLQTL